MTPESPLREVQVEALVVMRIVKHSTTAFPTTATGCLVGMDIGSQLQVTNCFPYPAAVPEASTQQDQYYRDNTNDLAQQAPRAKSNVAYQNEMIKYLREVNVDAQAVGWYMSCSMGGFVNNNFIENQSFFQRATDEKTVALVFDVSKSSQGSLSMHAYRLSPSFMAAYREGKFTTETYVLSNPTSRTMLTYCAACKSPISATRTSSSNCPFRSTTHISSPRFCTNCPRSLRQIPHPTSHNRSPTSTPTQTSVQIHSHQTSTLST